jgi:hypothetical protein
MQKLIVSMVRFTTALTLYGLEQVQTTTYVARAGQDLFKVLDKLEITLNSLTEALIDKIDDSKRGTLRSVTDITEDVVGKSFDSVNMMDPRSLLRLTDEFWNKTSDVLTGWFEKPAPENGSEPRPAADIMS